MAIPQQSPASVRPIPSLPACPNCGKQMRLVCMQPSVFYLNVERWSYACECGQAQHKVVVNE